MAKRLTTSALKDIVTSDCVQGTTQGVLEILEAKYVIMPHYAHYLMLAFAIMFGACAGCLIGIFFERMFGRTVCKFRSTLGKAKIFVESLEEGGTPDGRL